VGLVSHDVTALIALDLVHPLEPDCPVADEEIGELPGPVVLDMVCSSSCIASHHGQKYKMGKGKR
jgi:hypothetical protein